MYLPLAYVNIAFPGDIFWSRRSLKDPDKTYLEDFLWIQIQRSNLSSSKTSSRHLEDVLKDFFKVSSRCREGKEFFPLFNAFLVRLTM